MESSSGSGRFSTRRHGMRSESTIRHNRWRAHFRGLLPVLLGFFSLGGTLAMAQSASTGTVSGLVTDPQAAAIKSAMVKLIDSATGNTRTTITNDAGRYDFPNVTPGVYILTVESP